MTPCGLVTLLTDFGARDPFVGIMKGVMLTRHPQLRFVDLTHDVAPQAVADAAFWLAQSYPWFPTGTVHLAVVDPGVGGSRAPLAVAADGHYFVGPDNGIFELVARRTKALEVHELALESLGLSAPSRTFHGRDVFAPAAAALAAGEHTLSSLGPARSLSASALVPEPELAEGGASGVVVVVDHFGNLITNVPASVLAGSSNASVSLAGRRLAVVSSYSGVEPGAAGAVIGSAGTVEVFVRDGSAAQVLASARGARVSVSP